VRLLLLTRHGQSVFNVAGVVNGDPALDRGLSDAGRAAADSLGVQLAGVAIDLCVTSRFPRAQETARLALGHGRPSVPTLVDEGLDDVKIGNLEGETLAQYHEWRRVHRRSDRFPGGESLDEAAVRYADAFERLAAHREDTILCVCHEIPVRYAVNAAAGSPTPDGPFHDVANATPYLFDEPALLRAVERLRGSR
jgi:broad specificity phosphatase PhoE